MKRLQFLRKIPAPLWVVWGIFCLWFLLALPRPLFREPVSTILEDKSGGLLAARIAGDGQWRFPLPWWPSKTSAFTTTQASTSSA
jgi:penicillin-binding protein 1C